MDPSVFYSVQAALVFLVVSSPVVYNLVQSIFGGLFTVAVKGCPTVAGLFLHTVVFGLVVYLLMRLQKPAAEAAPEVPVVAEEKAE